MYTLIKNSESIPYPETPMKATKSAAYVAVATIVSVLLALKKTDNAPTKAKTEILTVTKLFTIVTDGASEFREGYRWGGGGKSQQNDGSRSLRR